MSFETYCDKCKDKISAADRALLIRHDSITAYYLTTLTRNACEILSHGDNVVLCTKCRDDFYSYIKGGTTNG